MTTVFRRWDDDTRQHVRPGAGGTRPEGQRKALELRLAAALGKMLRWAYRACFVYIGYAVVRKAFRIAPYSGKKGYDGDRRGDCLCSSRQGLRCGDSRLGPSILLKNGLTDFREYLYVSPHIKNSAKYIHILPAYPLELAAIKNTIEMPATGPRKQNKTNAEDTIR